MLFFGRSYAPCAYAAISSRSTLGGVVHNAYDAARTPAGSSGGSAVAVACNFAAAGVGTDTGGSIRNPSSFNNLYGIRPSKGLTSIGGVLPLKAYKDTTGPMARSAEDLALMLEIMAGTDENDDYTFEADAIAYLTFFDVPEVESAMLTGASSFSGYDTVFGPKLGLPDMSIPMGFSKTDDKCKTELPLGLSVFAGYGKEQTLMQIAYAYEKQAGDIIRREPENTPALEDEALAGFLRGLIDRAYSIDYSKCGDKPEGKVQLMLAACEKAAAVDMKDPYATYEAAKELAQAYDSVIEALEG